MLINLIDKLTTENYVRTKPYNQKSVVLIHNLVFYVARFADSLLLAVVPTTSLGPSIKVHLVPPNKGYITIHFHPLLPRQDSTPGHLCDLLHILSLRHIPVQPICTIPLPKLAQVQKELLFPRLANHKMTNSHLVVNASMVLIFLIAVWSQSDTSDCTASRRQSTLMTERGSFSLDSSSRRRRRRSSS
jgi:hypothetical protein